MSSKTTKRTDGTRASPRDAYIAINSAMTRLMRQIRRIDERQSVGRARLSALAVLHFGGDCSLTELARAEMVTRATMHHVVAGLEKDLLVSRAADPADARRQILSLTAKGSSTILDAHGARIDYLLGIDPDIPARDLEITARTMLRLRDAAARGSGPA